MINATDAPLDEMPPVVPCPAWCDKGFHPWEPNDDEDPQASGWVRIHGGDVPVADEVGVPVTVWSPDFWVDGVFERVPPCVLIDGQPVNRDHLAAILQFLDKG
jgi:hypothetical protein